VHTLLQGLVSRFEQLVLAHRQYHRGVIGALIMLVKFTDFFGIQLTIDQDPHQVGSSQNISEGSALPPTNAPKASTVLDSASADVSRPPTRRGPDQSATNGSFSNSTSNELVQASVLGTISSLAQADGSSI
jgi:hypothetical protein